MDADEVTRLVKDLNLTTEAEAASVTIVPTETRGKGTRFGQYLVGKIFDSRVANREALRTHIPRILQTRRVPEIEIVGDNLFVIVFSSDDDRRHALYDGPWHYFNCLMVFKAPVGLQNPTDIVFNEFIHGFNAIIYL